MTRYPTIPLRPATTPTPLAENGKRFFIWTIGCQMNEADSAKVAAMLLEVGYRPTEQEDDADIIVLNSCVVRQAAEDKVSGKLNYLARLKREKPEMQRRAQERPVLRVRARSATTTSSQTPRARDRPPAAADRRVCRPSRLSRSSPSRPYRFRARAR